jgi:tyrosinase
MKTFWYDMQGGDPAFTEFMGVHTAGHFTVGADPGSDFFTSPGMFSYLRCTRTLG